MTNATKAPQIGLNEEAQLEDMTLLDALRDREAAKKKRAPYVEAYRAADELVKGLLGKQLEAGEIRLDGSYRCGEFLISPRETDEAPIEFTRGASTRFSIKDTTKKPSRRGKNKTA